MSRATAAVRFEDGTVKWCLYNGTSDVLAPKLYDDMMEAWNGYYDESVDNWAEVSDPHEEPRPVVICTDYGVGFYWEGTAVHDKVIGPLGSSDDEDLETTRGLPDWFREACLKNRGSTERKVWPS